jgi:hypothetical protein
MTRSTDIVPEVDPRHRPGGSLAPTGTGPLWSDDQLREINTIDDLKRAVVENGVDTADASAFGNGYSVLVDKNALVDREIYIIDWRFNSGIMGEFATMLVLAEAPSGMTEKWIVNDGSTGIRDQLHRWQALNDDKTSVIRVRKGLRVSRYTVMQLDPKTGVEKPIPAETFYISTEK